MNVPDVLTLLLLGHVLGDFYLQWEDMAKKKIESFGWLCLHGLIYAVCITAPLVIGVKDYELDLLWLILAAGLSHISVDFLRQCNIFHVIEDGKKTEKRYVFVIDQITHIGCLIAAYNIFGKTLAVRAFMTSNLAYPSQKWSLVLLGLLAVIRPIGLLIEKGGIWLFDEGSKFSGDNMSLIDNSNPKASGERQQDSGRMIGYLERIIAFILILITEYGAIGMVIAAKSLVRFPEIKADDKWKKAKYYIIGTFLSMISVFAVMFLLGLLKQPAP